MFWLGCLNGYLVGTLITFLMVYFGYRISEMNKAEKWHDEPVLKKMEQLKALRDDKG